MTATLLLAGLLAAAGVAVVVVGLLGRARSHELALVDVLALADGDAGPDIGDGEGEEPAQRSVVVAGTLGLASRAVERWDGRGTLRERIERADLSIRPAELVVIACSAGFATGVALAALTGLTWIVPIAVLMTPLGAQLVLDWLAARRASRFSRQLPDALSLVAGSLAAGHTFLRSIQLMSDEFEAPLADEFSRVVAETQLGLPLVTSLERMAVRLRLRDVEWMVQAIRIQQTVGGSLSDLLATLADFMRSRDEVRREIRALTAEGRLSAWILGAMPVLLFIAVQVVNPGYVDPMLQGWGLVWLGLSATAMGLGMWFILRMVARVDV